MVIIEHDDTYGLPSNMIVDESYSLDLPIAQRIHHFVPIEYSTTEELAIIYLKYPKWIFMIDSWYKKNGSVAGSANGLFGAMNSAQHVKYTVWNDEELTEEEREYYKSISPRAESHDINLPEYYYMF